MGFGEVRSLLNRPPSEEVWAALVPVISALWSSNRGEETIFPYCSAMIESWPAAIQRAPSRPMLELMRLRGMSPWVSLLNILDWRDVEGSAQLKQVLDSKHVANLRSLTISCCTLKHAETLKHIGSASFGPTLEKLRVYDTWVEGDQSGDSLMSAMLSTSAPPNLNHLELDHMALSDDVCTFLVDSTWLSGLHFLAITQNWLTVQGARQLTQSGALQGLRTLRLCDNELGDKGVEVLANAPCISSLTCLRLSYNDVWDRGVMALAMSSYVEGVEELNLYANNVGDLGAIALATSPKMCALRILILTYNERLGDEGILALIQSKSLLRLEVLELSYTSLSNEGAQRIAMCPGVSRLRKLELPMDRVGESGTRALAQSPYLCDGVKEVWRRRLAHLLQT